MKPLYDAELSEQTYEFLSYLCDNKEFQILSSRGGWW